MCLVFNPRDRTKIVEKAFPQFYLGESQLQFVSVFKYLSHMSTIDLSDDTQKKTISLTESLSILLSIMYIFFTEYSQKEQIVR